MIPYDDAFSKLIGIARSFLPVIEELGKVSAEDIRAGCSTAQFNNSAMNGYWAVCGLFNFISFL